MTPILRSRLQRFTSREVKSGAHQIDGTTDAVGKLPLVGGAAVSAAVVVGTAVGFTMSADAGGWWLVAAAAGFFFFGLTDDVWKSIRGHGAPEGAYFVTAVILAVAATALIVGPGAYADGASSPYSLAHWVGPERRLPISAWYFALFLGTALATSFSDGMDGLTAGTVGISLIGGALVGALAVGAELAAPPVVVAAAALGFLVWNLPSRWAPSSPGARRVARAYLGDSGALALGAAGAGAAIVGGFDLLWPVIAAPLLLEGFSSLIQAKVLVPTYRRIRDPRLPDGHPLPHERFPLPLLASPLHHHWEKLGMDRRAIVLLMWSATFATAASGVLAAAMPDAAPAAMWIGIGATTGAAFWVAAMWLRPAFVTHEGDQLVLAHGRPVAIGPIRLYRRRYAVGGRDTAAAAARQGFLGRPMNALELAERLEALNPAPDRTGG